MKQRVTLVILCSIAACLLLSLSSTRTSNFSPNDFAYYWSGARLIFEGKNPYSLLDTVDLQRRSPFLGQGGLLILSPPWVLSLVAPLGFLSFPAAKALWFLLGLLATCVSVHWLWEVYGTPEYQWFAWLLTATFLPVAVVLSIGQIGPLVLLGLAGYLRFEKNQARFLPGVFLFLASLKPHLTILLWVAFLIYSVHQRRWRPVAGFLAIFVAASLLALMLDRHVFNQYAAALGTRPSVVQETPTLAGILRHLSGLDAARYLPLGLALMWLPFYWARWRENWDWPDRMPRLLVISLAASSYGWFFDQVVLLPSVLCAGALVLRSQRRLAPLLVYLAINSLVLLFLLNHKTTYWYAWTPLAWLALFLWVEHRWGYPRLDATSANIAAGTGESRFAG